MAPRVPRFAGVDSTADSQKEVAVRINVSLASRQRGVRLLGGSEVAAERFADQLRRSGSLGLGPLQ